MRKIYNQVIVEHMQPCKYSLFSSLRRHAPWHKFCLYFWNFKYLVLDTWSVSQISLSYFHYFSHSFLLFNGMFSILSSKNFITLKHFSVVYLIQTTSVLFSEYFYSQNVSFSSFWGNCLWSSKLIFPEDLSQNLIFMNFPQIFGESWLYIHV